MDNVNHPSHYTEGKIECIEYIEDKLTPEEYRGYIKGNVLKYITREKYKNGDEDIRKAKWYLDRLVSRLTCPDGNHKWLCVRNDSVGETYVCEICGERKAKLHV